MAKRVYWKIGDHEIEVEGDVPFIDKQLKNFIGFIGGGQQPRARESMTSKDLPSKIVANAKSGKIMSPAEYYRLKNPNGGTETLIVLGKYLDEYRNKSDFARKDIKAIAHEARLEPLHAQYYANAVKQGLLRSLGKGTYGLSISGEDAVAAMPASKKE
jgi:hypothetical protein